MNADEVMRITEKLSNFLSNEIAAMTRDERLFTPRDMENAVYQGIRAAYEAGEIAMKEKAAQRIHHAFCRTIDRVQNICDCDEMAESIRALPLSGAEKSVPAAPEEKGGAR